MKRLDQFAAETQDRGIHLQVNVERLDRIARTSSEGLFHVPLLSLCILIVARAKRGELATSEIASWTGATLGQHFYGIAAAQRRLEWSLQHRRRCADALVFLENVDLITIRESPSRQAQCTEKGLAFVRGLLHRVDDVGFICRGLERSYRAVDHQGLELL